MLDKAHAEKSGVEQSQAEKVGHLEVELKSKMDALDQLQKQHDILSHQCQVSTTASSWNARIIHTHPQIFFQNAFSTKNSSVLLSLSFFDLVMYCTL